MADLLRVEAEIAEEELESTHIHFEIDNEVIPIGDSDLIVDSGIFNFKSDKAITVKQQVVALCNALASLLAVESFDEPDKEIEYITTKISDYLESFED